MNQQFVVITPAILQSEPMPLFFDASAGQRKPADRTSGQK